MKLVAYIMIFSLMFLGISGFMETMDHADHQTELACEMDCCASHDDCEKEEQVPEHDHTCVPGCDCDCCLHIMALEYQFLEMAEVLPQVYYYGTSQERYHFEYITPIFQPPRLG